MDRNAALQQITELVEKFASNRAAYTASHSNYNETQLRVDFLDRFLMALGWDVLNDKQAPQHLREVVHEDTVEIQDDDQTVAKRPDYALRLGTERKFFVEAKRPSVPIAQDRKAAFQVRRYGWSARLPISVLSNFDKLVIYDCRVLNAHRASLERRSIQGAAPETWYRYGRSQSLTRFDGAPKLIWPVLSLEARYAYDDRDVVFTGGGNGPYYGLRPLPETALSIHYLQAVLSHPVIEAMVQARGSAFRGGYRSHGKQFVKDLPIRPIDFTDAEDRARHDRIVNLVQSLIQATERIATATIPERRRQAERQARRLRRTVEQAVGALYGLTEADLRAVGVMGEAEPA